MSIQVKICGLSTAETVDVAIGAGADYLGFTFFARSPRHISFEQATLLGALVPASVAKVALCVDADDVLLDAIMTALEPDILQLHGSESPERLLSIKSRYGVPLMKAIPINEADDLQEAVLYRDCADLLLFDAKPPKSMANALPGGNGLAFDWSLLAGQKPDLPWMLSGGLTPGNVGEAIAISGAPAVDVSSGVESAPGQKSPELITRFIQAAKSA
ncbi:MAG: phosphoribosylanthranilate isomerase [Rhizobiales bacterium]|nr:phosphoribosylanthranilate isomerase [Hyphomicrobiales bacterium]